ncbi:MAG: FAD-dependent oxidoreductase [Anaerolineae bacterium]
MHEVIVIGGGFSGLAACWELERRGVPYLLVEVKRTLGGSLRSQQVNGLWLDQGAAAFLDTLPPDFWDELGLADQRITIREGVAALRRGMGQLIDALAQRLRSPRMMQTAVSSLGPLGDQWGVCMENGVLISAPRVIVAAPARYAARMLINPLPEAIPTLAEFVYSEIVYVALVFRRDEISDRLHFFRDVAYVYALRVDDPARAGDGQVMFHVAVRFNPQAHDPQAIVDYLLETVELPRPVAWSVGHWPESDPLSVFHDDHAERMAALMHMLPPRMALINSDFTLEHSPHSGIVRLDERWSAAQEAVAKVLDT